MTKSIARKLMLHNTTYESDVIVEQNYAGILMGLIRG